MHRNGWTDFDEIGSTMIDNIWHWFIDFFIAQVEVEVIHKLIVSTEEYYAVFSGIQEGGSDSGWRVVFTVARKMWPDLAVEWSCCGRIWLFILAVATFVWAIHTNWVELRGLNESRYFRLDHAIQFKCNWRNIYLGPVQREWSFERMLVLFTTQNGWHLIQVTHN